MTKTFLASTAMLIALALPASAGTAPTKSKVSPETIAAACQDLGSKGEAITGGCLNTGTGAAVTCGTDGQCKDYFADPRYSKIKALIDGGGKQQSPVRL